MGRNRAAVRAADLHLLLVAVLRHTRFQHRLQQAIAVLLDGGDLAAPQLGAPTVIERGLAVFAQHDLHLVDEALPVRQWLIDAARGTTAGFFAYHILGISVGMLVGRLEQLVFRE